MVPQEILRDLFPQTPMVEITITSGCLFFVYSLVFGFLMGMYYELFRILRRLLPENTIAVVVEDILFCLSVTVLYICLVYCANYGFTRSYSLIAAFTGFYLYLKTLGELIKCMHEKMTELIKGFYSRIKEGSQRSVKNFKKYIKSGKCKKSRNGSK